MLWFHPGTRCTRPAGTPQGCWGSLSPWKHRPLNSGELTSAAVSVEHHSPTLCANAPLLCPRSTEFVEEKIEEFLVSFGERLSGLSEEAFKTQVTALIKLKECEDAHLGEEVDRNWFEVVTQQYVFKRLDKEVSRACFTSAMNPSKSFSPHVHGYSFAYSNIRIYCDLTQSRSNILHF